MENINIKVRDLAWRLCRTISWRREDYPTEKHNRVIFLLGQCISALERERWDDAAMFYGIAKCEKAECPVNMSSLEGQLKNVINEWVNENNELPLDHATLSRGRHVEDLLRDIAELISDSEEVSEPDYEESYRAICTAMNPLINRYYEVVKQRVSPGNEILQHYEEQITITYFENCLKHALATLNSH